MTESGWHWDPLGLAELAHYFMDGLSICGCWLLNETPMGDRDQKHCPECERRLATRKSWEKREVTHAA